MKKQLLLKHRGIFIALLSFLCVTSIQAQTWTAPTFEHQTDDLSSHVGEVFYLYNVGLNAYVTYGAEYGTRAVMGPVGYPMYLRASGSNYKFEFVTSPKHNGVTYDLFHAGSGTVYTDNTTSSDWTCTYDATSKSYTVVNTAAATTYLAPNSTVTNHNNNNVGNGFEKGGNYYMLTDNYATNNDYAKWRFVTPKQKALLDLSNLFTYVTNNSSLGITLTSYVDIYNNSLSTITDLTTDLTNLKNAIYATATISNPVEVTSFTIASPSFEFKAISSMDSWVVTTGTIKPTYSTQISGTFPVAGSSFLEYYLGSGNIPAFTIQQTINSLPAGKYSLKAILKGSTGTGTTSPANIKLFAGSYNTSITTTPTTATQYEVPNILTPSDGSSLNIGLQYTTGAAWLATDYFQLYYYGPITSSTTWTSSTSTWSNGTPTADVNAVIPSSNTYNGPGFTCCSLDVEAPTTFTSASTILGNLTLNNTLTVNGAYTLTINGAVSATSSITATDGTVVFNGSCAQQTCPLTGTVANLTINNAAAGGVVLANSTTVSGTLTLSAGTLTNSTYLTLSNGATIVRTAGSLSALPTVGTSVNVTYDGSSAITMGYEITGFLNTTKLNNLTVSNGISVTLPNKITVNGNLNLAQSNSVLLVAANGNDVTLNGNMLGSGYIEGNNKGISVTCSGSSAQTLRLTNTTNLNINNPAGVTLGRSLGFNNWASVNLYTGQLSLSSYALTPNTNNIIRRVSGSLNGTPTFNSSVAVEYNNTTQSSTTINASTSVTLSGANTYIVVGMGVTGIGIAAGTTVATVSGTALTLSQAATADGTNILTYSTAFTTGSEIPTSATVLGNLTINTPSGVTLGSSPTVNGTLTFTSGNLTTSSNTLTLKAATSGTGGYIVTGSNGTVAYAGSGAQTISNLNGAVNNLTVNNAAGATLGAATTVSGALTLTYGTLNLNSKVLTFGNGASIIRYNGGISGTPTPIFGTTINNAYNNYPATTQSGTTQSATQSGTTTATSPTVTLSASNSNISVGMTVTGTGIPALTTVSAISSAILTLSQNASATGTNITLTFGGSSSVTLTASNANIYPGMTVTGSGISGGTTVLAISGASLTLSQNAIAGGPNTLTFSPTAQTSGSELPVSTSVLSDLTINNTAGVTLGAPVTVNGALALTTGTLATGANTLTLKGATTGSGLINTGTSGTLTYGGTAVQTLANTNLTGSAVKSLVINAGSKLTTSGTIAATTLNINSATDGSVGTLIDNGSLTATTANVQQYLTGAGGATPTGRYWYLTSPVVGATSSIFNPSATANRLWSYNEAGGATSAAVYTPITVGTDVLNAGKGYVTRLTGNTTVNFTGTALVNGSPTIGLTYTSGSGKPGFNLIGNPYPSYLNIRSAFNAVAVMEKGIWYRSSVGDLMGFDTYNIDDSTQVKHDGGTTELSSLVPPMQAFWVKATASGTITLSNAMRTHKVSGNLLRSSNAEMQKIRLIVSNGVRSDETLLGFYSDASDAFDNHDSRKMFNGVASLPEIFTLAGSTEVAINGLSPLVDDKEIILGFNTLQAGTFTIKASELLNMEEGQTVILKDKLLNVTQNLTEIPEYSFTSTVTNTTDRFSLVIGKVATALATVNNPVFAVCTTNGNMLEVALSGVNTNAARITVFNALGQELASFKASGSKTVIGKRFESGVYMVKVVAPGFQATRKVIINN